MRQIARMHARWWNSPRLGTFPWLRTFDQHAADREALLPGLLEAFLARWSSRLSPELREFFEGFPWILRAGIEHLAQSDRTLVHTDLNLGNLVFVRDADGLSMRVIDWQDVIAGPVGLDLFLPMWGVPADDKNAALRAYAEELKAAAGVEYALDRLATDVAISSLFSAYVALGRGAIGTDEQDRVFERAAATRQPGWLAAASHLR